MHLFAALLIYALNNAELTRAESDTVSISSQNTFSPVLYQFKILDEQPHISQSFTQGFVFDGSYFFESSGLYGQSFLVSYNPDNAIRFKKPLPASFFAEGLTVFEQYVYVITWKSQVALRLHKADLSMDKKLSYQGEGWGLTHDSQHLIMSDGTNKIRFFDPKTFRHVRSITVNDGTPQNWRSINELEYARGLIWANIWKQPVIIAIKPDDGKIVGKLNLEELVNKNTKIPFHEALNGIAYDAARDAFWVTGKYWKNRYLIDVMPKIVSQNNPL